MFNDQILQRNGSTEAENALDFVKCIQMKVSRMLQNHLLKPWNSLLIYYHIVNNMMVHIINFEW